MSLHRQQINASLYPIFSPVLGSVLTLSLASNYTDVLGARPQTITGSIQNVGLAGFLLRTQWPIFIPYVDLYTKTVTIHTEPMKHWVEQAMTQLYPAKPAYQPRQQKEFFV